jgi:hypothetical protein
VVEVELEVPQLVNLLVEVELEGTVALLLVNRQVEVQQQKLS